MAPIEELEIINLETRHLPGAMALSGEAGWNQVASDWSMMLAAGDAIGIEAPDGQLIATALALPFEGDFGWISMMLVTARWRKQGLAKRLLQLCIERLERQGLTPMLDATPLGEPLYRSLGFKPVFGLHRWQHESATAIAPEQPDTMPVDADTIFALDRAVFGAGRAAVLKNLLPRCAHFSCMDTGHGGYLLGRDGRLATQIGPVAAPNPETARAMLAHAIKRISGPVYIDICDHQDVLSQYLQASGFVRQRPLLRMARGGVPGHGNIAKMVAVAGPELG